MEAMSEEDTLQSFLKQTKECYVRHTSGKQIRIKG